MEDVQPAERVMGWDGGKTSEIVQENNCVLVNQRWDLGPLSPESIS